MDGSVGYDFANLVNGILIDQRNERLFTNLYHRVIGASVHVDRLIYESKKLIMQRALASEVNVLTHMLNEISNQDRRARDFTRGVLREAIRETIACFPVYRTYIDERGNVNETRSPLHPAGDRSGQAANAMLAPAVFDFLRSILLLEGKRWRGDDLRLSRASVLHSEVSAAHRTGDGQGPGRYRLLRLHAIYFGQRSGRLAGKLRNSAGRISSRPTNCGPSIGRIPC